MENGKCPDLANILSLAPLGIRAYLRSGKIMGKGYGSLSWYKKHFPFISNSEKVSHFIKEKRNIDLKNENNINRDHNNNIQLRENGWEVLRIWEHNINKNVGKAIEKIINF